MAQQSTTDAANLAKDRDFYQMKFKKLLNKKSKHK